MCLHRSNSIELNGVGVQADTLKTVTHPVALQMGKELYSFVHELE